MQREVKKIEAGVGDRVAKQRHVTEEHHGDRQSRKQLRAQKGRERTRGETTMLAGVQAKRLDREEQEAHNRKRRTCREQKVERGGQQR